MAILFVALRLFLQLSQQRRSRVIRAARAGATAGFTPLFSSNAVSRASMLVAGLGIGAGRAPRIGRDHIFDGKHHDARQHNVHNQIPIDHPDRASIERVSLFAHWLE